ncbi:Disheveled-associated activator of morphogenesis 1-A [Bienertia sinuspersici]
MALIPNVCIQISPVGLRMNFAPALSCLTDPIVHFSKANHPFPVSVSTCCRPLVMFPHCNRSFSRLNASPRRLLDAKSSFNNWLWLKLPGLILKASTSSLMLVALGIFTFSFSNKPSIALASVDPAVTPPVQEESNSITEGRDELDVDDEQHEAFEKWKSKTYALTVPLTVVALQGSVPPAWIKDFIQSQGKRSKLRVQFRGNLENIFSELSRPLRKGNVSTKSAVAADLITVGDSWLDLIIGKSLIEPVQMAEDHDWFKGLNNEGKMDPAGRIWAVPYRWGSMVIAYKKGKFDKLGLAPIEVSLSFVRVSLV